MIKAEKIDMSIRTERVGSVIRKSLPREINVLANEHKAGLVTITDVKVSKDLQHAYVYLTAFGGEKTPLEFISVLEKNELSLRLFLNDHLRLRSLPVLKFYVDDSLDKVNHIEKVISDIKDNPDKNKDLDFDYLNKKLSDRR
jgi:ribosome-binding factor A